MIPVKPDKITIDAVMVVTMVAAIGRTKSAGGWNFPQEPFFSSCFSPAEVTPDLVKSLARHK
jgi:hypothetical protein